MIGPLFVAVRPRQWVKNLFVGAPLIFAKTLLDPEHALRAAAAVAIFCVITSAVYLWNDLVDVEKDRAHPRKRTRPIASGALPIATAKAAAATCAALGLALALLLDVNFAIAGAAYLTMNVAYTLVLKRIPYVDVLVIASGFLLRVLAGSLAIHVHASPWLLVCTGLLASFLGFGKRTHELRTSGAAGVHQRDVLASYDPAQLRIAFYLTGGSTIVAYLFYTLAEHTRVFFGTTKMVWTAPAIAIGIGRFLVLTANRPKAESPTEEILRDPLFLGNLAAWVLAVIVIIYFAH